MSDNIPYVGFSNETLRTLPRVNKGDLVKCHTCDGHHVLRGGTANGVESDLLMFFSCGNKSYLGAIDGHLITGTRSDCHGEIPSTPSTTDEASDG